MGHEVRRVPLDFELPLERTWSGFLTPDRFDEIKCPDCKAGYSSQAQELFDRWYGYAPFDPCSTGSTPLTSVTPAVRARAERNVTHAPDFYGAGEHAIVREGCRLASLWNRQWSHHLSQDDVDALIAGDRLWDFTHRLGPDGWEKIEPTVTPTAAQVNEWSLTGCGHDALNASIVVRAACRRAGVPEECATCQGHGSTEAYPGQRAEAEAWEPTQPPTGDGWQLWETVSEGSPISPVFAQPEALAHWMASPAYRWGAARDARPTYEQALRFIQAGCAPSMIATRALGVVDGVIAVGTETPSA